MADDDTVAAAGEAAVGMRATSAIMPAPAMSGGDRQHLAHAGPTLRPLVADDQHITLGDLALENGLQCGLLLLEHPGRAGDLTSYADQLFFKQ